MPFQAVFFSGEHWKWNCAFTAGSWKKTWGSGTKKNWGKIWKKNASPCCWDLTLRIFEVLDPKENSFCFSLDFIIQHIYLFIFKTKNRRKLKKTVCTLCWELMNFGVLDPETSNLFWFPPFFILKHIFRTQTIEFFGKRLKKNHTFCAGTWLSAGNWKPWRPWPKKNSKFGIFFI